MEDFLRSSIDVAPTCPPWRGDSHDGIFLGLHAIRLCRFFGGFRLEDSRLAFTPSPCTQGEGRGEGSSLRSPCDPA
jgi:hypothetical protein